jgi:hypothetical protein
MGSACLIDNYRHVSSMSRFDDLGQVRDGAQVARLDTQHPHGTGIVIECPFQG